MLTKQDIVDLASWAMPFGRYKNTLLIDLPEEYLLWFTKNGWPEGRLGYLMQVCLEIKIDGSESVVKALKSKHSTEA